ncbi:MAG: VOC family protein, partial [Longimicrobiales bacterium]
FELYGSHDEGGRMDFAHLKFGDAEIMFTPSTDPWRESTAALSLWIHTSRLDDLYALFRRRQLERARAELDGASDLPPEVRFSADLYTAFYGQREFAIRDPNGIELWFYQPVQHS